MATNRRFGPPAFRAGHFNRAGAKAHVHRDHRRAARGLPAVRGCPGPHQGAPAGVRQTAHPAEAGARRQGVRLPEEPRLPAQTWHSLHHPGQGRPGPQPKETWLPRRPSTEVRPGGLQGSERSRVRHQSPQETPRRGHEVRQTRGPIRGNRPGSGHQRVAVTSTFDAMPSPRRPAADEQLAQA